jgi:cell division protein FtsB
MARAPASSARSAATLGVGPLERVRWDRVGRIAMLCVLAALLYLYISAGVRLFSTWREARSDSAQVAALEHEHTALVRQHETLDRRGDVEAQARKLGMMKANEQPYVITGLPNN